MDGFIGFLCGMFFGCFMGCFVTCLMVVAGRGEDDDHTDQKDQEAQTTDAEIAENPALEVYRK